MPTMTANQLLGWLVHHGHLTETTPGQGVYTATGNGEQQGEPQQRAVLPADHLEEVQRWQIAAALLQSERHANPIS